MHSFKSFELQIANWKFTFEGFASFLRHPIKHTQQNAWLAMSVCAICIKNDGKHSMPQQHSQKGPYCRCICIKFNEHPGTPKIFGNVAKSQQENSSKHKRHRVSEKQQIMQIRALHLPVYHILLVCSLWDSLCTNFSSLNTWKEFIISRKHFRDKFFPSRAWDTCWAWF